MVSFIVGDFKYTYILYTSYCSAEVRRWEDPEVVYVCMRESASYTQMHPMFNLHIDHVAFYEITIICYSSRDDQCHTQLMYSKLIQKVFSTFCIKILFLQESHWG